MLDCDADVTAANSVAPPVVVVYTLTLDTNAAGKDPAIDSTALLAGCAAVDAVIVGALFNGLTTVPIFTATPEDLVISDRVTIA